MTSAGPRGAEDLLRELAPQALGAVARRFRTFDEAEDAVQEALLAAATRWPRDGVPDNARAWLVTVATRRMTDRLRQDEARRRREAASVAGEGAGRPTVPDRDDSLDLFFLCCHPVLTPASAIPLTLRAVGGLTTAEIARAFLVPESTMAQRISRAKRRIKESGEPFAPPTAQEWDGRLRSVLKVLYLVFTEGHSASAGLLVTRTELSAEAIRLTRMVHAALPEHPEVAGLLALMLLDEARRPARTGPHGELVPLDQQDRSLWDRALVAEGVALVSGALPRGAVGEYQLQAAIAALHDEAPTAEETDWPQIRALYTVLERMTGNPLVSLNLAVAVAMVEGPAAGLARVASLGDRLAGNHRIDAVRAHLHEMAGDHGAAGAHYRLAAGRTTSMAERDYLVARAARLERTARLAGQDERRPSRSTSASPSRTPDR